MGSKIIVASIAVELCVVLIAASGCASGSQPRGFGDSPSPATGTQATPLGTYPASASLGQKYGIAEWRTYVGKTQIVVTGYRADGTAARGVQLAWFPSTATSVGHTRLTMLDGTGAVLRRMVGGGETGHLSTEQTDLLQTMRYDLARAPRPAFTPLHGSSFGGGPGTVHVLDDSSGMPYGTSPNTGPQCMKAMTDPSIPIDAAGCGFGAATFETVMGGIVALGTCTQWYAETKAAQATCDTENSANCNGDTCTFGQNNSAPPPTPTQQCDNDCLCANYGAAGGAPCSRTCVDNNACDSGQECHWGSCGPAPAKNDNPTDQNVSQQGPGAPSCGSGDVTADPSNGQVGCSSSGASGGSSGGGSGSSSGTDPGGTDPTTGGSSSGGSGSGGSSSGGSCADDGAGCAQDSDCCLGACNAGTCGTSGGDGSGSSSGGSSSSGSGSSSGGGCAADGDACSQDSDCCGGTCDSTSGTCGAGSGSSSGGSSSGGSSGSGSSGSGSSSGGGCAPDGSACAQGSDCCGGSCDTASGTCGAGSGSSSGGGSSGGGCGNPGDPCGQDSDCCSGSCDTGSGTCN